MIHLPIYRHLRRFILSVVSGACRISVQSQPLMWVWRPWQQNTTAIRVIMYAVAGGVWIHCSSDAVASHSNHQAAASFLPPLQCDAVQVRFSRNHSNVTTPSHVDLVWCMSVWGMMVLCGGLPVQQRGTWGYGKCNDEWWVTSPLSGIAGDGSIPLGLSLEEPWMLMGSRWHSRAPVDADEIHYLFVICLAWFCSMVPFK